MKAQKNDIDFTAEFDQRMLRTLRAPCLCGGSKFGFIIAEAPRTQRKEFLVRKMSGLLGQAGFRLQHVVPTESDVAILQALVA